MYLLAKLTVEHTTLQEAHNVGKRVVYDQWYTEILQRFIRMYSVQFETKITVKVNCI